MLAARGLSDLLTVLRTIEHECTATGIDAVTYYDATELPVFGGDAPEETSWPIRSWDTNNLLVGAGNVIEWTSSEYEPGQMEARGGGWATDTVSRRLRASYRTGRARSYWHATFGFRCAIPVTGS